jgi:pimeloyl-ACP methyl ester carboxylesterase
MTGTLQSPDFLTNGEDEYSVLRRGGDGLPEMSGMRDANLTAIIPACVETATLPVPVMIFGHGLFGSGEGYLNDRFLQQVAQDYCFVVVAGDWIGLTERQIGVAALAANDLNMAGGITEKLAQSVIDFISIEQAVRGPLAASDLFELADGTPIIDPTRVYYFGASLGGIMGSSFMAYDPFVTRGVLGVPGGPWSMLFERSYAWNALQGPAHASYTDPANFQMLISLLAMRFEPYDPITAAPHLIQNPLPDTPVKQIFLYETVGDSLVANISSETLGRTIGLPIVMPTLRSPYGLAEADPSGPNGFSIYDESPDPLPSEFNIPPQSDNGTHADVHERPAVLRQIEDFLYNGVVTNQCSNGTSAAPCDCAAQACE